MVPMRDPIKEKIVDVANFLDASAVDARRCFVELPASEDGVVARFDEERSPRNHA